MQIADLILPEDAHVDLAAPSKLNLLQILSDKAAAALGLRSGSIVEVLHEREKLGSTGIGGGVAIPHGRLAGLARPFGMVARLKRAIEFDAVDEKPVDIVFVLLIPQHADKEHLNALACIAKRLRAPDALQRMRAASDAKRLYESLIDEDQKR